MAKTYPLEIACLYDIDGDWSLLSVYSQGHHDPAEFVKMAKEWEDIDCKVEAVKHKFMRWEMGPGPDGPTHVAAFHKKSGRGIFPITIVELQ